MADHLVLLHSRTPLRIRRTGQFAVAGVEIAIDDWFTPSPWSGAPRHQGLLYRVRLQAESPRHALEAAHNPVELVNNILAASHAIAVLEAKPIIAFDVDLQSPHRRFAQSLEDLPTEIQPHRDFRFDVVAALNAGRDRLTEDEKSAVDRALWHLRKSASLDELVGQFTELWIGLDAVNGSIQQRHGLKREEIVRRCKNCGSPAASVNVATGAKHAIQHLAGYKDAEWKEVRELRQWILHGRPGFVPRNHDFPRLTGVLRHALVAAIADLMRITAESSALLRSALRVPDPPSLLVWGSFPHMTVDEILIMRRVPRLVMVDVIPRTELPDKLAITVGDVRMRFRLDDARGECRLEGAEIRTYRDPEALAFGSGYGELVPRVLVEPAE